MLIITHFSTKLPSFSCHFLIILTSSWHSCSTCALAIVAKGEFERGFPADFPVNVNHSIRLLGVADVRSDFIPTELRQRVAPPRTDIGRFESRPSRARTSVPEAGSACTRLKSNKGTGPRNPPEENGTRQSRRDQEPRRFALRIQTSGRESPRPRDDVRAITRDSISPGRSLWFDRVERQTGVLCTAAPCRPLTLDPWNCSSAIANCVSRFVARSR